MKIDVLTLFPNLFPPYLQESILKAAQNKKLLEINTHDLRASATDRHHTVDDTPYGGGTGMVLKVDVVDQALSKIRSSQETQTPLTVLLSPQGEKLTAKLAEELAGHPWLILVCGHYEGFDERIRDRLTDRQVSIGDYVLTGGELPALVLIDAVARFVPGVLPIGAASEDSFSLAKDDQPAKEYPQYTKPAEYKGWSVPDVLLSGNHAEIAKWRQDHLR